MAKVEKTAETVDTGKAGAALRKTAAIIPLVLAVVTALSPLFGDDGVAEVVPLPKHLESVGRPLITGVALVLVLITFVELLSNELGRRRKYVGVGAFLAAVALLGIYMSWLTPAGVVPPELPLNADVVALFVVAFGIGLLAISQVVLASMLVVEPSADPVEPPPTLVKQAKTKPTSKEDTTQKLAHLVLRVDWQRIEQESRSLRSPYWRLYGATARMLVVPQQGEADLRRMRFWVRVLSLIEPMLFSSKRRVDHRGYLLAVAGGLLPWLALRNESWRRVEALGETPDDWGEAFTAYLQRFLCFKAQADYVGYSWLINEAQQTLSELLAFRDSIPPMERSKIRETGSAAAAITRLGAFKKGKLMKVESEFDAALVLAATTGERAAVATNAYTAASSFLDARNAYPMNSTAWHKATISAMYSYCLGIAASEPRNRDAIEALTFLVERSATLLHVDTAALVDELEALVEDGSLRIPDELRSRSCDAIRLAQSIPLQLLDRDPDRRGLR